MGERKNFKGNIETRGNSARSEGGDGQGKRERGFDGQEEQERRVDDGKDKEDLRRELNEATHEADKEVERGNEEIRKYLKKNIPENGNPSKTLRALFGEASRMFTQVYERLGGFTVEGKERVPKKGPLLIIANHTRNGDPEVVRALVERDFFIVAADMHFSNVLKAWFMKKIGAIEVEGTLSHYTEEEREAIMKRVPSLQRAYYEKVLERDRLRQRESEERRKNAEKQVGALRHIVARLAQGEAVVLFPEGLWTYEGNVLRQAQKGGDVIALEYKRLTGRDLPILPVAISDNKVEAGRVQEGRKIDEIMKDIAGMLPGNSRGFYSEK